MNDKEVFSLCDKVRETSFALHQFLGHGHLEKVYENGLAHRLRKQSLTVDQQHRLNVHDEDGTLLGEYAADLLVEGELIVELKACRSLADEHVAQLLGYVRACNVRHGLLVNFGAAKLEKGNTFFSHKKAQRAQEGNGTRSGSFVAFVALCGETEKTRSVATKKHKGHKNRTERSSSSLWRIP